MKGDTFLVRALHAAMHAMRVIMVLALILPVFSHAEEAGENAVPHRAPAAMRPNARYVVVEISQVRSDQYMLDTQTGQLWNITLSTVPNPPGGSAKSTGKAMILVPVPYVGADGRTSMTPK